MLYPDWDNIEYLHRLTVKSSSNTAKFTWEKEIDKNGYILIFTGGMNCSAMAFINNICVCYAQEFTPNNQFFDPNYYISPIKKGDIISGYISSFINATPGNSGTVEFYFIPFKK